MVFTVVYIIHHLKKQIKENNGSKNYQIYRNRTCSLHPLTVPKINATYLHVSSLTDIFLIANFLYRNFEVSSVDGMKKSTFGDCVWL